MSQKLKAMVSGANGMLGKYLCRFLQNDYQVFAFSHQEWDITQTQITTTLFTQIKPDIVFHLAALTNVDLCEQDPELAYQVNYESTKTIAQHCLMHNCTLVYISTGMVFPGTKEQPYTEEDTVDPVNIYGKSKWMGEQSIYEQLEKFYIIRTTWLFGGGIADKKFVAKMISLGKSKQKIQVVNDKWGTPTYASDLAKNIISLIKTKELGLYHVANLGMCNRAQFAQKILEYAQINCKIEEVPSSMFPTPAPRPKNESIVSVKLRNIGWCIKNWKEVLGDYISNSY